MAPKEKPPQRKREIPEAILAPYREEAVEEGNGHTLFYSIDEFGRGEEHCVYYSLKVYGPPDVADFRQLVAMSLTPEPDDFARREFTLDFLLEQKK